MIDMKLTNQAKGDATMLAEADKPEGPEYPYGLRISLDNDSLTKLGMNELPALDAEFTLTAKVCVVSVSQHESQGSDKPHRSVDLQIEMMALASEDAGNKSQAERMYGS
jgi:hypothetical protein